MNIRDYFDSFKQTEFVEGITSTPLQYGYINSRNDFNVKSTNQTAIVFDKDYSSISLLPQVNRGDRSSTQGKERTADTFALKLAYFKHADRLTGDDIQSWRRPGFTDSQTYAGATAEKLEDIKRTWNQTQEYMKLQAKKGVFKTPDGTVVADMFAEFGITQQTLDFGLGTNTTEVARKVRQLKTMVSKSVMNGGAIGGIEVLVDPEWFDKFISHASMKNAYQYYAANGANPMRDSMTKYMQWGVMDEFTFQGVSFVSYDATFNLPGGTTEVAFAPSTGIATAVGVKDLFRGYNGPSVKLSEANQPGQELFMRTYVDPKDEFVEFEIEAAPLFFCTRPASLIAVTSN
ncbi:MAG: major capsid protein [Halobacteriota archaeon]